MRAAVLVSTPFKKMASSTDMVCSGQLLTNLGREPQNVVIYVIDPFPHAEAIVDLCAAFVALSEAYNQSPATQECEETHEIVLQIIPMECVLSDKSVPILSSTQFFHLSLELYEKCTLTDDKEGQFRPSAPCVLLEEPIPKRIPFILSPDPPQSLLHERSCLHIAYSCGVDDRWISVAWSDSRGGSRSCTSFCLVRKEFPSPRRSFDDVAQEIWERSVELVETQKGIWRFMLVKAGVMEMEETEGTIVPLEFSG